jgi:hypothetical protein
MKKNLLYLLLFLFATVNLVAQKELIVVGTGYGFDKSAANGINPGVWSYFQKWASLSYNGQDASVTAARLHIQWNQYEPTAGNYQGAKLAQAVAAIISLKPGMKVALHFPYQRPGPQPGQTSEGFLADDEVARIYDGTEVKESISYTIPSVYSETAKTKFYNFVNDALAHLTPYYSSILYVEMGNGDAEEFIIPVFKKNGYNYPGCYEQSALDAWRTQYLPCRYPGQSTVNWDGNTYTIASAPSYSPAQYADWSGDLGHEYHRFASWGLMKLYKGFRDVVKSHSSSLKVLMFSSGFGTSAGNVQSMHNSLFPMDLVEFDGMYTTEGTSPNDSWRKIMPLDVLKGTNPNKIAANEFDPEDLGEQVNPRVFGVQPNIAAEWIARSYKHGADYVHFAMSFDDSEIDQLAPALVNIRSTYLNGSYTSPSRQPAVTVNIYPTSFTGNFLFDAAWNNQNGNNWATTDLSPKSVNMVDDGYWQNIWSCTAPNPCDFNPTATVSNATPAANANISLSYSCSGSSCSGVTYSWSGNGASGSTSPLNITAPGTAGTYTYTVTASKSGCSNKTATVQITVSSGGGGGGSLNQCIEAESSSGNGSITSDPTASNGQTRGLENNYNHYVDYAVTGVPSAGTYTVQLQYYSSAAPVVSVSVNGGSGTTVNLANSGSWNITYTTQSFTVTLAAGSNTIRIQGTGGGSCKQDKICVTGSGGGGGCTPPSAPSLSASPASITSGSSSTLSASGCSGGTITWSDALGTGTSKSVSPAATKTYTASCTISSCTSSNGSVTVTVTQPGGSFSQCLESESSSGNGSITSDPNASNGQTRGLENNYNHYVDYAVTGVPSAGTYNVQLRYFSSSAPVVSVSVNGGSGTTVNLANSGAWNITPTTQTFQVTLASGSNTIRIQGTGGGSCKQDKICVSNTGSPLMLDPLDPGGIKTSGLLVSPNPGRGVFQARFYLNKVNKATLTVVDLQGRTIYRQTVKGQGQHNEKIDLSHQASGILLLQLHSNGDVQTKKINLIK